MGQFFIICSRKLVNWNSPVFYKRYFFICSTYTSNKCFFIITNNFKEEIKPLSTIFYTPFWGASKSRPRCAAHTRIGNVWEYPPPLPPGVVPLSAFLSIMFLSRDNCVSHCSSPGVRLGFGFVNWISASSNFTSSRNVPKATEGWTGGFQSDFTWNGCGSLSLP